MKTKEKCIKFLFLLIAYILFLLALFVNNKVQAVSINGKVADENDIPIQNITVKGDNDFITDSYGYYEINNTDDDMDCEFSLEERFESAEAISEFYVSNSNKKFNIVIVKPEDGYEYEYKEIEFILSNCNKENEKIMQYNASGFIDGISDPYQEYKDICGSNYLSNEYINLFIVIAKNDIPMIKTTNEQGDLSKGNIFFTRDAGTKIPKYGQASKVFEKMKQDLCDYANIEYRKENLVVDLKDTNLNVKLKDKYKNQRVNLKLERREDEALIDGFITGYVYLKKEDESISPITKTEYLCGCREEKKITVELKNINTGELKTTEINSSGKYGFDRPTEGTYIITFKYNGQEFKAIDEIKNTIIVEDNQDNHSKEIGRDVFNNRFKPINNELAKKIYNWDNATISIYAETEPFEVKDDIEQIGNIGDVNYKVGYIDPKKYINLIIKKRPEFDITFKKEINVVKVTLADTQVYKEKRKEEETQIGLRQIIMDEELMHGATIEVEYLITAKSNNGIGIEEIEIIDYLDYENNKIEYNPKTKLLTDPTKTNEDLQWQRKLKTEISNIEENLKKPEEENGLKESGTYLLGKLQYNAATGLYETKLAVSKLISSNLTEEALTYSNFAEILSYSNSEGRRIKWADELNLSETDINIPGNYNPNYIDNIGKDTSVAEDVFIIPPFGRNSNVFVNLAKYIKEKLKIYIRRM